MLLLIKHVDLILATWLMCYYKLFTCTSLCDGRLGKKSLSMILVTDPCNLTFAFQNRYFNTLDITLDRAGYYICWGCLVWVQAFYGFHSYFFVYYQPNCGPFFATLIFVLGVLSIYLNYDVDRQKEIFRTSNGKVKVSFSFVCGANF